MGVPTLEHPQLCSKPCCAPETDRRLLPSPPTSPTGGGGPSTQRQVLFVFSNLARIFLTWIFKHVFRNEPKRVGDFRSNETGGLLPRRKQASPRAHQRRTQGRHLRLGPPAPPRTIQELGTLDVALLHLFTLVRGSFNVADGGGKNGGAALHQLFAEVDAVARGSAVQRRPGTESG